MVGISVPRIAETCPKKNPVPGKSFDAKKGQKNLFSRLQQKLPSDAQLGSQKNVRKSNFALQQNILYFIFTGTYLYLSRFSTGWELHQVDAKPLEVEDKAATKARTKASKMLEKGSGFPKFSTFHVLLLSNIFELLVRTRRPPAERGNHPWTSLPLLFGALLRWEAVWESERETEKVSEREWERGCVREREKRNCTKKQLRRKTGEFLKRPLNEKADYNETKNLIRKLEQKSTQSLRLFGLQALRICNCGSY